MGLVGRVEEGEAWEKSANKARTSVARRDMRGEYTEVTGGARERSLGPGQSSAMIWAEGSHDCGTMSGVCDTIHVKS